jgi:hypothetical protein
MNQIQDFNPNRPKVSLRRFTDAKARLAIAEYILNRGTQAEAVSLENIYRVLVRQQRQEP